MIRDPPLDKAHAPARHPLPFPREWHVLKDAFYKILSENARAGRESSDARAAESRFFTALGGLPAPPDAESALALEAALADLASDFGRHVLAKRIVEDSVDETASVLRGAFHEWGAGAVRVERDGVRRLVVHASPAGVLSECPPRHRAAFLRGLLRGVYGEAFNSEVDVMSMHPGRFHVELGHGRNVNVEVRR